LVIVQNGAQFLDQNLFNRCSPGDVLAISGFRFRRIWATVPMLMQGDRGHSAPAGLGCVGR
jgi:hypothetical protein